MRNFFILVFCITFLSCKEETLPKPKGYLRLTYPKKIYKKLPLKRPYSFKVAENIQIVDQPKEWLKIKYPNLKASIDITYRPIQNNLKELFLESEKLVFKHTVKADGISGKNFVNADKKVYGTLHKITGNAASQIQFHVTDSTRHFLKGSLFFYTKPNYDSILPAIDYLKKDMIKIMETLEWNDK